MIPLKERLQEILLQDKLINLEDLGKALRYQEKNGGELSKILVEQGFIKEEDLTLILSQVLGMPPIDLSRFKIDPLVVRMIPQEIAIHNKILPIAKIGDTLTLAMADPLNILVIDNIQALTGLKINPIISRAKDILEAIDTHYSGDSDAKLKEIMKDISGAEQVELLKEAAFEEDRGAIEHLTQEAPTIKLTEAIIRQAVAARASDIFIEPMEKILRIRYRVDGIIREVDQMPKNLHLPIISRIKVISSLDIAEHRLPQDGRFKIVDGAKEVDFRVNVLPAAMGEKVVLRVLDKTGAMLDLSRLGFDGKSLEILKECSLRPHGMILTCGPTGSGKTTTLYSILKFVDSPEKNIITVEDPVEYQMPGLNQVNIRPEVGLTFASALRAILRQDPDIIMIGEIRDYETMDIAVKAALTGHLVLSSLHTTTAAGSVVRMMNMGVEPFLLCSSVIVLIAQRLLRKVCEHCKESYVLSKDLAKKMDIPLEEKGEIKLFRGKGCKQCLNSGYKGRVGIIEMLYLNAEVKELIMKRAGEFKIKEAGRRFGMVTMREDALAKAFAGLTSMEEVLRVTAADE